jgi:excisionase family DNA binding protein
VPPQDIRTPKERQAMTIERIAYRPIEAADALGVSRSRIYAAIAEGSIRTIVVGTRLRIPAAELARIAEEGMPSGPVRGQAAATAR